MRWVVEMCGMGHTHLSEAVGVVGWHVKCACRHVRYAAWPAVMNTIGAGSVVWIRLQ